MFTHHVKISNEFLNPQKDVTIYFAGPKFERKNDIIIIDTVLNSFSSSSVAVLSTIVKIGTDHNNTLYRLRDHRHKLSFSHKNTIYRLRDNRGKVYADRCGATTNVLHKPRSDNDI